MFEQRSSTLLTIFANHLTVDAILSLAPKVCGLYVFNNLTRDLCSSGSIVSELRRPGNTANGHACGGLLGQSKRCQLVILAAHMLLLGVLVAWTLAQWSLGITIRSYARALDEARKTDGVYRKVEEGDALVEQRSMYDWESESQFEKTFRPSQSHTMTTIAT